MSCTGRLISALHVPNEFRNPTFPKVCQTLFMQYRVLTRFHLQTKGKLMHKTLMTALLPLP